VLSLSSIKFIEDKGGGGRIRRPPLCSGSATRPANRCSAYFASTGLTSNPKRQRC